MMVEFEARLILELHVNVYNFTNDMVDFFVDNINILGQYTCTCTNPKGLRGFFPFLF